MTVTKRGASWFGTEAGDLNDYLTAFAAGGYPIHRTARSTCAACEATVGFSVLLDDERGLVVSTCAACSATQVMLDGAEYLDEADLGEAACPCGHEQFDVAVGFSLREDDEVRWFSVGLRCQRDGLLGVYIDGKIDYSPRLTSSHWPDVYQWF